MESCHFIICRSLIRHINAISTYVVSHTICPRIINNEPSDVICFFEIKHHPICRIRRAVIIEIPRQCGIVLYSVNQIKRSFLEVFDVIRTENRLFATYGNTGIMRFVLFRQYTPYVESIHSHSVATSFAHLQLDILCTDRFRQYTRMARLRRDTALISHSCEHTSVHTYRYRIFIGVIKILHCPRIINIETVHIIYISKFNNDIRLGGAAVITPFCCTVRIKYIVR